MGVQFLRQSTAVTITAGPFVDSTDGATPENGLTISQADVQLDKNGAGFDSKAETSTANNDAFGFYSVLLNATDTDTLGRLVVSIQESGALPWFKEYMVIPANVYDSLVAGSDALQVDTIQVSGMAQTAKDVGAAVPSAVPGAAGGLFIAGTNAATTITSSSGSALTLSSTGGNGHGVVITGNGGGEGVKVTAGATGNGIEVTTQTGTAILAQAVTDGSGILATGAGTGDDIALGNNDIPDIVAGLSLGTPAGASISADIAAIDTVVDAILVDTGTTLPASLSYAKDDVNDKRTWTFTKNTNSTKSPRIVTVHPDFDGTLKFDLTNMLNTGAGINAITSVTVDPTGPTVGATSKTSDNKCVLFDIDGAQIDNTDYTFTCTVTTTDSDDALIVTGVMKSRSS